LPGRTGRLDGGCLPPFPRIRANDCRGVLRAVIRYACGVPGSAGFSLDLAFRMLPAAAVSAIAGSRLGLPPARRTALVDDTGLSIHGGTGCPAPRRLVPDTVGPPRHPGHGAGLTDRRATVTVALGYADADGVRVFQGPRTASLAPNQRHLRLRLRRHLHPRQRQHHRTYAQMTSQEKNKISHRKRAVQAMRTTRTQ